MNKILCPIDFSDASKNGMEYAANLAKALKAILTLLYVRTSIWPEAIQLERELSTSNEAIQSRLSLFAIQVQKEFGIPCDYHIEQTTDTFEETVATLSEDYDLIVMGTNGADTFYQYVYGSNSFHVIENSKCPVLIVPEGCTYRTISRMIYAYDPEKNPAFSVEQLKKIAIPLNAEVRLLHITNEKPTSETKRKMEILQDVIKDTESKQISWSFDFEYSDEVSWALDRYLKIPNGDILALSFYQRSLVEKLFKESVVKQISMVANYPVFVFWH
jgi:nucleotide-binding universal stress UspA family protein